MAEKKKEAKRVRSNEEVLDDYNLRLNNLEQRVELLIRHINLNSLADVYAELDK